MKTCSECNKTKIEGEFYPRTGRPGLLKAACKECDSVRARKWRDANPEKVIEIRLRNLERSKEIRRIYEKNNRKKLTASQRKWARENPDKVLAATKKYRERFPERARQTARRCRLKRDYSITVEDFERLKEKQGGLCAICGKAPVKNLFIDHNHTTGKVRGLLCSTCNCGIGQLKESKVLLAKAILYLNEHE